MMFNVPQYIDVEDKIAGPLTAKQFGWMIAMTAALIIENLSFDTSAFYTSAVPTVLLFVALAFYKPQGIPLIKFIWFFILFLIKPKQYMWSQEIEKQKKQRVLKKDEKKVVTGQDTAELSLEDITLLAQTLDTGGRERNKHIEDLLKKKR